MMQILSESMGQLVLFTLPAIENEEERMEQA
jgi:hypothetical protein